MGVDLHICLKHVEAFEARHSERFDWVIRLRTDAIWYGPIGPLSGYNSWCLHVRRHGPFPHGSSHFGILDDRFALVPRHLASTYFNTIEEHGLCKRVRERLGSPICQGYPAFFPG